MESRTKADRAELRLQVVPSEIRGLISGLPDHNHQPFLIWDVSENGIGIWTSTQLPINEKIMLTIGQPYLLMVKCEVVWCEKQASDQGFRVGLRSVDTPKIFGSLLTAYIKAGTGEV